MRHFIVVEGLIGVGKSTLCRLISHSWQMRRVLEPAETNPFLDLFYRDSKRYAFPVQMFYMVSRWRQQESIRQQELFEGGIVSDYLFAKDRLFAEMTLDPMELELYDRFVGAMGDSMPVPDLVVYLEAPINVIMSRIAARRAPGEGAIDRSYIVDLKRRYETLLDSWTQCPVLRIDNRDLDYSCELEAQQAILNTIHSALTGRPADDVPGSLVDRQTQPDLFGSGAY